MEITKIEPRLYTYRLVPDKKDPEYATSKWKSFGYVCENDQLELQEEADNNNFVW